MPITPATTTEIFQTPDGRQWRLAGTRTEHARYFVPADLDPTTIPSRVWASEDYLATELGDLTPVPADQASTPA